jgi:hypothetical protein
MGRFDLIEFDCIGRFDLRGDNMGRFDLIEFDCIGRFDLKEVTV